RIVLTINGLNNEIIVEVVEKLSTTTGAEGVAKVTPHVVRSALEGQNEIKHPITSQTLYPGNITMLQSLVMGSGNEGAAGYKPAQVLIHEATHKFAGTIDYCYFDPRDGSTFSRMGHEAGEARELGQSRTWYQGYDIKAAKDIMVNLEGAELARLNADSF